MGRTDYPGGELAGAVAVVGMAGRFPGAASVEELWQALRAGQELITFYDREQLLDRGVSEQEVGHPRYVAARGALSDPFGFDAPFFGYSAREAELMDPQQRTLLEIAWLTAEDAGYVLSEVPGKVAVFASVASPTYLTEYEPPGYARGLELQLGSDPDFASSRISYKLDLTGPSVTVSTACSSGLAAVHFACQSLLAGDSDAALALAASIRFPADRGLVRTQDTILSADGHCRAFGAEASGTVEADGAVGILVKRLEDALADGDHIHAVVRGSAMGNDAAGRVGFTAPGARGQQSVLADALRFAGVRAEDVSYVEAHGTGTPLGDPIEMQALAAVYGSTERAAPCGVGSVKSNLGHLNHASGLAGLVKTVLCLSRRELVPTLHAERPNPELDFAEGRLHLQTTLASWDGGPGGLTAAVSSFGMGGTNVHMIVSEAPPAVLRSPPVAGTDDTSGTPGTVEADQPRGPGDAVVLPLSAATPAALGLTRSRLASWLRSHPEVPLGDVAHTLQTGRAALSHRAAFVCRTRQGAIEALERPQPAAAPVLSPRRARPVVFLFPGQGSQRPGMAAELYRSAPVFRTVLDECLSHVTQWPELAALRTLLLDDGHREHADLDQTVLAQPALFVTEFAMARQWMAWGVTPEAMIGHSLGEYVAACVAEVFSVRDAMTLVMERGRMVQSLPHGAMIAVRLGAGEVEEALKGLSGWDLSAHNAPHQCVVSGPPDVIAAAERALLEQRVVTTRLAVSHAFHSRSVEPVLDRFAALVERTERRSPSHAYLTNVTGRWVTTQEARSVDHWVRHLRSPVRFEQALEEVTQTLDPVFLHLGPGTATGDLARENGARDVVFGGGRGTAQSTPLDSLTQLWTMGARVDWPSVRPGTTPGRVSLPGYPFEHQTYVLKPRREQPKAQDSGDRAEPTSPDPGRRAVKEWFYTDTWEQRAMLPTGQERMADRLPALWMVIGSGPLADEFGRLGRHLGKRVATLDSATTTSAHGHPEASVALSGTLEELRPGLVLVLLDEDSGDRARGQKQTAAEGEIPAVRDLMTVVRAAAASAPGARVLALTGPAGAGAVFGSGEPRGPVATAVAAAALVLGQENPELTVGSLAIDAARSSLAEHALAVARFLSRNSADEVVLSGSNRLLRRRTERVDLVPGALPPSLLKSRGVYLITGGTGAIGLKLASHLARRHQARLVLVGRRPVPDRGQWPAIADDPTHPFHSLVGALRGLEAESGEVTVVTADVGDAQALAAAWDTAQRVHGRVDGVVHAAGLTSSDAFPLARDTAFDVTRLHLRAKAGGLRNLASLAHERGPDFVVAVSSLATVLGGLGFTAYASASAYMEALTPRAAAGSDTQWCAVRLDSWQGPADSGTAFRQGIDNAIEDSDSDALFDQLFRLIPLGTVSISTTDLEHRATTVLRSPVPTGEDDDTAPALGTRYPRPALSTTYRPPGDEFEELLVELYSDLLRTDGVGVDDDFFELGGHSLLAMNLAARIGTELDLEIGLRVLFDSRTVASLALALEEKLSGSESAS